MNRQTRRRLDCSLQSIDKEAQNEGTYKVKVKHRGENNRRGTAQSVKTNGKQRRNSERGAAPGSETNAKPKENLGAPLYRPLHVIKNKATFVKLVSHRYQTLNLTMTATSHMLSWGTPGTRVSLCCSTTGEIHRSTSWYSWVKTLQKQANKLKPI